MYNIFNTMSSIFYITKSMVAIIVVSFILSPDLLMLRVLCILMPKLFGIFQIIRTGRVMLHNVLPEAFPIRNNRLLLAVLLERFRVTQEKSDHSLFRMPSLTRCAKVSSDRWG